VHNTVLRILLEQNDLLQPLSFRSVNMVMCQACECWCCDTLVCKNHKQRIKMMKVIEHLNKKVDFNVIIEHEILLIK